MTNALKQFAVGDRVKFTSTGVDLATRRDETVVVVESYKVDPMDHGAAYVVRFYDGMTARAWESELRQISSGPRRGGGDTLTQARFRALVTAEASQVEVGHPADERVGPTRLNLLMGWRPGNLINGWATRVRREVLEELGFEKVHDRWVRVKVE